MSATTMTAERAKAIYAKYGLAISESDAAAKADSANFMAANYKCIPPTAEAWLESYVSFEALPQEEMSEPVGPGHQPENFPEPGTFYC